MAGPAPCVSFTGGTDPRTLQLHRFQPQRDVPFVPSDDAVVSAMLRLAQVTKDDVVYDLGCGDGRLVIAAVKRHGARGLGVDIERDLIDRAQADADLALSLAKEGTAKKEAQDTHEQLERLKKHSQ